MVSGSGRYGRRSTSRFDSDCLRVAFSDLTKAGLLTSLHCGSVEHTAVEVELNGRDSEGLRVRLCLGSRTGNSPLSAPTEGIHVPHSRWISADSLFVPLCRTTPNFGGFRMWFCCPRTSCGRRCAVLYRPRRCSARAFACRHCYRVKYKSQRIARGYRLENRAERILGKLTITGELAVRPKGCTSQHIDDF